MKRDLALILVLSLADWALTVDGVAQGICREASPIFAAWLNLGAIPALILKVGVAGLGVGALVVLRRPRIVAAYLWLLVGLVAVQALARLYYL